MSATAFRMRVVISFPVACVNFPGLSGVGLVAGWKSEHTGVFLVEPGKFLIDLTMAAHARTGQSILWKGAIHCYCCVSYVCLLIVEGDTDGVGKGEIGIIVGEFSKSTEEAEVVEAEDFGAAFSLHFQVLAGTHCVVDGTNGQTS
jgi:hypothetical protein